MALSDDNDWINILKLIFNISCSTVDKNNALLLAEQINKRWVLQSRFAVFLRAKMELKLNFVLRFEKYLGIIPFME